MSLAVRIQHAVTGAAELVQFGLPLPRGRYQANQFQLYDESQSPLEAHIEITSYWPDKSVRWCWVSLVLPFNKEESSLFVGPISPSLGSSGLDSSGSGTANREPIRRERAVVEGDSLCVNTQEFCFKLNTQTLSHYAAHQSDGREICSGQPCRLEDSAGEPLVSRIEETQHHTAYAGSQPLYIEVRQAGHFLQANCSSIAACFQVTHKFHYLTAKVETSLTLHNPKAAKHEGGTWDLGDPNSLFFNSLTLQGKTPTLTQAECFDEESQTVLHCGAPSAVIHQESSGGKAWNSPNHVNRDNQISMAYQGYTLTAAHSAETGVKAEAKTGAAKEGAAKKGTRTQPVLSAEHQQGVFSLLLKDFWQQFPSQLALTDDSFTIALFPPLATGEHELQPGESKTHHYVMRFADNSPAYPRLCQSPYQVMLEPEWVEACQVIPWFGLNALNEPLQAVIGEGLNGESSLLNKREQIDQYGWRHFGELYADHEAAGYEGDELFISHYNNQYDPLYGLLKQALLQRDQACFQQGIQLAQHITDIDIYHTQHDKDEYNQGLFWHTDHYQKAETCSHRTYSKRHKSGVYDDYAGGGGPGGQHCYSTGLLLTYWLTGNQQAKEAVLGLGGWIESLYEGRGTVIELLLSLKNRARKDLKNPLTGQYPLDRGIGNYINTLIDCYYLTSEQQYLDKIAHIIQHTVHPADDISQRDFDDIEETWFYTVFFQAVGRYLVLKCELEEFDEGFVFARDCLSHYAVWMAEHEQLSLTHAERLEFPNLTWTAQDLRKVGVLYLAGYFEPEIQQKVQTKADQLYRELCASLTTDELRTQTRVLAILMQNHGIKEWVEQAPARSFPLANRYGQASGSSFSRKVVYLGQCISRALLHLSPQKEIDQLKRRFPQTQKLLGKIYE